MQIRLFFSLLENKYPLPPLTPLGYMAETIKL
jgi:hypothetical protein